ncbi:MAG: DUF4038 domain-containing protein [Kiritimatiellae bacterium]|nr:DUF4038 domain-containing protein [Kiritimatiellia bacterium]
MPAQGKGREEAFNGPLRVDPRNGRYFTDNTGEPVYLTGSHTWANLQELKADLEASDFDFAAHLQWLKGYGHNVTRLWAWEQAAWTPATEKKVLFYPHAWPRTGPGSALDGLPKFDLTHLNEAYFTRLRERVVQAAAHGLYVMVMLFQGFSISPKRKKWPEAWTGPWPGHPFNRANNISGIDGDPKREGHGRLTHTLEIPAIVALQERYVRKVVDTLNDLDNVLFEIGNECHAASTDWQYHMIRLIREHEAGTPKQHPLVMTFQWDGVDCGTNRALFDSPADAVSLGGEGGTDWKEKLMNDPPPADGTKVSLLDTDHFFGTGGDRKWVWKSFCRGHNPIFMDPIGPQPGNGGALPNPNDKPEYETARRAMGQTLELARRVDLAAMAPHSRLSSTRYCLANGQAERAEYIVYAPDAGPVTVDLSSARGRILTEWIDPVEGRVSPGGELAGGAEREVRAPFESDAVLHLKAEN